VAGSVVAIEAVMPPRVRDRAAADQGESGTGRVLADRVSVNTR
jgi:hypothetical protein